MSDRKNYTYEKFERSAKRAINHCGHEFLELDVIDSPTLHEAGFEPIYKVIFRPFTGNNCAYSINLQGIHTPSSLGKAIKRRFNSDEIPFVYTYIPELRKQVLKQMEEKAQSIIDDLFRNT